MSFRQVSKKVAKRIGNLKCLPDNHDPANNKLPIKSSDKTKPVHVFFNSFRLADRHRFTLRAYGRLFNYHGVLTKYYDMPVMLKLFFVTSATIYNWVDHGFLPAPFIRVVGKHTKVYWFYHQVQPFYTWYWNKMARGFVKLHVNDKDLKKLKQLMKIQERQWHIRLGIPYVDAYTRIAGKYGVIYPEKD